MVRNLGRDNGLCDIWEVNSSFTWNRANSDIFSTIDRILFSKASLKLDDCAVNWSVSRSDHGSVEAFFSFKDIPKRARSRIVRIDPLLAKVPSLGQRLINEFNEMLNTMPIDWDPHKKLEFAKVCIRTVSQRLQAENNRAELT